MENKRWFLLGASVIGNAHLKNDIPCQDSHAYCLFDNEIWGIAIISDGAGSHENSDIGSKKIVEIASKVFEKIVRDQDWIKKEELPTEEVWFRLSKEAFKSIYQDLLQFANQEEYNINTLGATLIAVVFMNHGLLISHIGDGRAGYCNLHGEWKSMMEPFKGEYSNETIFLTSIDWESERIDHLIGSNIVKEEFKFFSLMSDGCENTCYEITTYNEELKEYEYKNKPFEGFFLPVTNMIEKLVMQGVSKKQIDEEWIKFLKYGTLGFREEADDKTLIIGLNNLYVHIE